MTRTIRILAMTAALLAGAAALAAIAIVLWPRGGEVAISPSAVGGPFSLTDQNGRRVTEADFKGKPVLVFFGFTNCPDICPTALFEMSEVLRRLGPDAEKVNAIFISVDPERDTAEKLKDYLQSFHARISALTGSQADIDAVTRAYKAYAKRVPLEGGNYTMDHSAIVYLMDKNGRFVAPFNLKRPADEAAADLRRYL
ncbi:MAG TPA: SCO family protein [Xanthobacteraceae bacterium]|nr:SCO family protein [Xanthobacteraceae bacterium]